MVWNLPRRFLNYERDPLRQENEEREIERGRERYIPKDENVKGKRETEVLLVAIRERVLTATRFKGLS